MNKILIDYLNSKGIELPQILVEDIEELSTEDWLKYRKQFIGGSDAGSIYYGKSAFKTASDIAISKITDEIEEETDPDQTFRLDFGHALEPILGKWYSAKTGAIVFHDRSMFLHPKKSYIGGDCDDFALLPDGEVIGLEYKTTNAHLLKEWKSGVFGQDGVCGNMSYIIQVMHYMMILGLNRFDIVLCAHNAPNDIIVLTVNRDEDMIKSIESKEDYFWEHKQEIAVLPPTSCDKEKADRYVKFCKAHDVEFDDETCKSLGHELIDLQDRMSDLKAKIKSLEQQYNAKKAPIEIAMGDNESVIFGDVKCSIKTSKRKGLYDTKELDKHPELSVYRKPDTIIKKFEVKEVIK